MSREVYADFSDRKAIIGGWNPVLISSGYAQFLNSGTGDRLGRYGMRWNGKIDSIYWTNLREVPGTVPTPNVRYVFLVGEAPDEFPQVPERTYYPHNGGLVSTQKEVPVVVGNAAPTLLYTIDEGFDGINVLVTHPVADSRILLLPFLIRNDPTAPVSLDFVPDHPMDQVDFMGNGTLNPHRNRGYTIETSAIRESGGVFLPLGWPANALYGQAYPVGLSDNPEVTIRFYA